MQIIDELETKRRGPYGGGFGFVSFTGAVQGTLAWKLLASHMYPWCYHALGIAVLPVAGSRAGVQSANSTSQHSAFLMHWVVMLQHRLCSIRRTCNPSHFSLHFHQCATASALLQQQPACTPSLLASPPPSS